MFGGLSPSEAQSPLPVPQGRRFARRRKQGAMSDPAPRRREATLNALERLLERHGAATPEATAAALGAARNSALPLLSGNDPTPAYQMFVTQAITRLAIEGSAELRGLPETLAEIERLTSITPTTVGLVAVSDPALLGLP